MLKRRLKEPFGKAGLIVAVVALVFAMLGGAYAATGSGGGKATASGGKQGKQGKPGKPGKTGPQGPAGPAGAPGAKGDAGATGANGTNGTNGTSVVSSTEPKGANCKEGGSKFVAGATTTFACNGTTGFTKTLPSKSTETGAWAFGPVAEAAKPEAGTSSLAVASFTIPLAAPLTAGEVHFIALTGEEVIENASEEIVEVPPTECLGTAAAPTAQPGNFCVYAAQMESVLIISSLITSPAGAGQGAGTTGALLQGAQTGIHAAGRGTWAVTAP